MAALVQRRLVSTDALPKAEPTLRESKKQNSTPIATQITSPKETTSIFPFENYIKGLIRKPLTEKLGIEPYISSVTLKQTIIIASNLLIAMGGIKLLMPILSPYFAIPISLGAMHIANKGFKKPERISTITASAVGLTYLVQNHNLPRAFIRPFMGFAVFMVQNLKKSKWKIKELITKETLASLGKLELLINTIPALIGFPVTALHKSSREIENPFLRFLSNVGVFTSEVIGLSIGFVSSGKALDKLFAKFSKSSMEIADIPAPSTGAICPLAYAAEVAEATSSGGSIWHGLHLA